MHAYLRAVGFSDYKRKKNIEQLLDQAQNNPDKSHTAELETGERRFQTFTETGDGFGLSICGEINEENEMEREFYFPFLYAHDISTKAPCQVQRHAEKESYSGMCEEYKVGVSLIFHVLNNVYYMSKKMDNKKAKVKNVLLSGLSINGKIMLPIKKTEKQREKIKVSSENRTSLLEEARKGNTTAMDTLALEDMNLYNSISGRIRKEDVYSIVDTSFMPYGVECDQYSIIGEILDVELVENRWTNEEIYVMTVEASEMRMRICINKKDLLGEPEIGRRFKGQVWLQGILGFSEE